MPGAADLLRAAGVARSVLGLVGRHRVARWLAVFVALGWWFYSQHPGYSGALIVAGAWGAFRDVEFDADGFAQHAGTDRDGDGDGDPGAAPADLHVDSLGWN